MQWFHFLGTEQQKKMKKDTTDRARMMAAGKYYEWYVKWLARIESWDCCCLLHKLIFILIVPPLRLQHIEEGRERRSYMHLHSLSIYILRNSLNIFPDRKSSRNKCLMQRIYILFARLVVLIFMYALCILPSEVKCHISFYLIKPKTYIPNIKISEIIIQCSK